MPYRWRRLSRGRRPVLVKLPRQFVRMLARMKRDRGIPSLSAMGELLIYQGIRVEVNRDLSTLRVGQVVLPPVEP